MYSEICFVVNYQSLEIVSDDDELANNFKF